MALGNGGAKKMTNDARSWLIQQMKGLILIGVLSLLLAICVNAFRKDRIPWVDQRRAVGAGDVLPHLPVYPAEDPIRWRYLGLPANQKVVLLSDAQADLLQLLEELLEIFHLVHLDVHLKALPATLLL